MLAIHTACVAKTSYLTLVINALLTVFLGIQMPKKNSRLHKFSKFFERTRTNREPPFFFQEVRYATLISSLIFNFARLIYEAIALDVSVLLVLARLIFTTLQLIDHWYMCKNWVPFFVEKKIRGYIWFRLFVVMALYSILYSEQTTFPPYSNYILIIDGVQWVIGIQAMIWYLWGRKFRCKWGDMSESRRIPAFVNQMFTGSLLYAMLTIYLFMETHAPSRTTTLIASIAYFLVGLIFRYLITVTDRSTKAISGILDASILAISSSSHHPPNQGSSGGGGGGGGAHALNSSRHSSGTHTPKSSRVRRNSKMMIAVRQSLKSHLESSQLESTSTSILPYLIVDKTTREDVVGRNDVIHEGDEEAGMKIHDQNFDEKEANENNSDLVIQPSSSSLTSPYASTHGNLSNLSHIDICSSSISNRNNSSSSSLTRLAEINAKEMVGNGSNHSNHNKGKNKDKDETAENGSTKIRSKPTTPNINVNGSPIAPIIGENTPNQLLGGELLPHTPTLPSRQNSFDMMIDHVPLERQQSLERNLEAYETAHFLSDKVVVVFVQVMAWYICMGIVEGALENYYDPHGYDDATTTATLIWCPSLDNYAGSTFGSLNMLIDALC